MCTTCGMALKISVGLKRYIAVYTGQQPYVFTMCRIDFRLKGTLSCHMKIQTGVKPYDCEKCGKAF